MKIIDKDLYPDSRFHPNSLFRSTFGEIELKQAPIKDIEFLGHSEFSVAKPMSINLVISYILKQKSDFFFIVKVYTKKDVKILVAIKYNVNLPEELLKKYPSLNKYIFQLNLIDEKDFKEEFTRFLVYPQVLSLKN